LPLQSRDDNSSWSSSSSIIAGHQGSH
jgi:hypothetical protein